jgi:hypothetical protein
VRTNPPSTLPENHLKTVTAAQFLATQYAEHRIDHSRRARLSADDRRIAMPESAKRPNSGCFEAFNRVSGEK